MNKLGFVWVLTIAACLVGCSNEEMHGKVLDVFGNPVENASVSVTGTEFKTESDKNGQFSLDYAPGNNIVVTVRKDNYLPSAITRSITKKMDIELSPFVLFNQCENGLFLHANKQRKAFDTLNKRGVDLTKNEDRNGMMFIQQETYSTVMADFNEIGLPAEKSQVPEFQCKDSSIFICPGSDYVLVRCGGEGMVAEILNRKINNGALGFYAGDYKDFIHIVPTRLLAVSEDGKTAIFKTGPMTENYYAWVRYNAKRRPAIGSSAYFFYAQ